MENICEAKDIMVVQGDILEAYFQFTGLERTAVDKVYFVSRGEQLEVECPYVDDAGYCLRLTSEQTENFVPKICSYDLIAKLTDGNILTALRQRIFAVLKKRNPLQEESETPPEPGEEDQVPPVEEGGEIA